MKKLIFLLVPLAIALAGCGISDDARETPIGTVISGETQTTDSYLQKVKMENRKESRQNKDVWRPEQTGF